MLLMFPLSSAHVSISFSGLWQTPDPFLKPTTHGKKYFSRSYEVSFLLPKICELGQCDVFLLGVIPLFTKAAMVTFLSGTEYETRCILRRNLWVKKSNFILLGKSSAEWKWVKARLGCSKNRGDKFTFTATFWNWNVIIKISMFHNLWKKSREQVHLRSLPQPFSPLRLEGQFQI